MRAGKSGTPLQVLVEGSARAAWVIVPASLPLPLPPSPALTPRKALRLAPQAQDLPPLRSIRVLGQLRECLRLLHYSHRTEDAYIYWVKAFVRFHGLRHPTVLGGPEVEAFLMHLANNRSVAPATHSQALSALLFFYGKVLGQQLPWLKEIGHPRRQRRLPVVLTVEEVRQVLVAMAGEHQLLAQLLYGCGLRITEALQLRAKDLDFGRRALIVREGKGAKDRVVMLPHSLVPALREQLARARAVWALEVEAGVTSTTTGRLLGGRSRARHSPSARPLRHRRRTTHQRRQPPQAALPIVRRGRRHRG